MRIVNLSYSYVPEKKDPLTWLKYLGFFNGILESMVPYAEVIGIYNIDYRGVLKKNGVTYHFPGYKRWQLLLPVRFNNYIKKLNPDVIIVHGLVSPWQVIMLQWQLGSKSKIIAQHHAERPLRGMRQYFQRWADHYIRAYLFCAYDLGQQWVSCRQIKSFKKINEIMEGSSTFSPIDFRIAKNHTKTKGSLVYLWVGGLHSRKDPLTTAKAFIEFLKEQSEAKLYIIFQTSELLSQLEALIKGNKSLRESIILVGHVKHDDLLYWYNSADFIISSSLYEGSGIAVCEAFSCGCIPILTNIPSFRMMTDDGRCGLLFNPGEASSLFSALIVSTKMDLASEKQKILVQFNKNLSFNAIAKKIMDVVYNIK